MPATTRTVGMILMVLGLLGYALTGMNSATALIPAFIGVVFSGLARAAQKESLRKHMMHAAVVLALVAAGSTLMRLVPALSAGQIGRPAVQEQLLMVVVLTIYVGMGIKSFADARRARS